MPGLLIVLTASVAAAALAWSVAGADRIAGHWVAALPATLAACLALILGGLSAAGVAYSLDGAIRTLVVVLAGCVLAQVAGFVTNRLGDTAGAVTFIALVVATGAGLFGVASLVLTMGALVAGLALRATDRPAAPAAA